MGKQIEFNWVLKLNKTSKEIENGLEKVLSKFEKEEIRIYPQGIPIILTDREYNAIAIVQIKSQLIYENTTYGSYKLIRHLRKKEKEVFTNFYKEFYSK
jgi:hypothetical protein